jgi:hypothetical protein
VIKIAEELAAHCVTVRSKRQAHQAFRQCPFSGARSQRFLAMYQLRRRVGKSPATSAGPEYTTTALAAATRCPPGGQISYGSSFVYFYHQTGIYRTRVIRFLTSRGQ